MVLLILIVNAVDFFMAQKWGGLLETT